MSLTHITLDTFNSENQDSEIPLTVQEVKQICEETVKDIKQLVRQHSQEILSTTTTTIIHHNTNTEECYKEFEVHFSLDFLQKFSDQFSEITISYAILQTIDSLPSPQDLIQIEGVVQKTEQNKLNAKINQKFIIKVDSAIEVQHIFFELKCKSGQELKQFFTIHKLELNQKIDPSTVEITENDVLDVQQQWALGIVTMGQLKEQKEELLNYTTNFLQRLYGFDQKKLVLFKPTKASEITFRTSHEAALSYFIGGNSNFKEDKGFAITPWTKVEFKNAAILCENNGRALAMGNYWFTDLKSQKTKVDYTFGYYRDEQGNIKIDLHHSSLPFVDNNEKVCCKKCDINNNPCATVQDAIEVIEQLEKENEQEQELQQQTEKKKEKKDIKKGTGFYKLPLYDISNFSKFYQEELNYATTMTLCLECSSQHIPDKNKFNELKYQCQDIHLNHNPFECASDALN